MELLSYHIDNIFTIEYTDGDKGPQVEHNVKKQVAVFSRLHIEKVLDYGEMP